MKRSRSIRSRQKWKQSRSNLNWLSRKPWEPDTLETEALEAETTADKVETTVNEAEATETEKE